MGKVETEVRKKTLVVHELSHIAKEKDQEMKLWEQQSTQKGASHDSEVKKT